MSAPRFLRRVERPDAPSRERATLRRAAGPSAAAPNAAGRMEIAPVAARYFFVNAILAAGAGTARQADATPRAAAGGRR